MDEIPVGAAEEILNAIFGEPRIAYSPRCRKHPRQPYDCCFFCDSMTEKGFAFTTTHQE